MHYTCQRYALERCRLNAFDGRFDVSWRRAVVGCVSKMARRRHLAAQRHIAASPAARLTWSFQDQLNCCCGTGCLMTQFGYGSRFP